MGSYWYLQTDTSASELPDKAGVMLGTPTPDTLTIHSPELASEFALPSPTPRPTSPPLAVADLVATWPVAQRLQVSSERPASINGELAASDGRMQDGTYVDVYEFTAAPGEIITVELSSTVFDAVVALVNSNDEVIAYNDDFQKESTDARLVLPAPHPDTYRALVNTYGAAGGAYHLQFDVRDHRQPERQLILGQPGLGWLIPGDATNAAGLYVDHWEMQMPESPVVVWARSTEFDPRLDAFDASGNLVVKNGDQDPVGLDYDARILLSPSEQLPPGSTVTLAVALQGEFAVGGAYELLAEPLPTHYTAEAEVKVRPIIVSGANGVGGSQVTPEQVASAIAHANQVWQACGIHVVAEETMTIALPELEQGIEVNSRDWTTQETALMTHPSHALPAEGVITAYFVSQIDGGDRYGIAYPTTRYPAGRSGIVLIADIGVTAERFLGTLAHEIGHMLGLNHPALDDGDGANDTEANLMFTSEGLEGELQRVYGELTPLQCITARTSPHFLHAEGGQSLAPAAFQRHARLLQVGTVITSALTTRDAIIAEGGEQFLDVYSFHAQSGETVVIELTSTVFDPVLLLDGPDGERLMVDDDGGGGWHARIALAIPATGDYSIGVTSLYRSVGEYQLALVSPITEEN